MGVSAEELRKQLAEIEDQEIKTSKRAKVSSGSELSVFAPLPEDWAPEPKIQTEDRPGSDPSQFNIGDPDPMFHSNSPEIPDRQAIPYPQYPAPGQLATKEIENSHRAERFLWQDAMQNLMYVIRHGSTGAHYQERWNFLLGLWAARGMNPPSPEKLESWRKEYLDFRQDEIRRFRGRA